MSAEIDLPREGWDRTLLDVSSKMSEPFVQGWGILCYRLIAPLRPNQFDQCQTRTQEIGTRILIALGVLLFTAVSVLFPVPIFFTAVILAVGSKLLRAIGFSLQKQNFTHVRGKAPEKIIDSENPKIKMENWNVLGITGLCKDHGGCIDWRSRLDEIVKGIELEDADILVLQEIYDTDLAEALIQKLNQRYAHFFLHLGKATMGSVGGCMVLSKLAVHSFSNTSFENSNWQLNRTFATLEVKANSEAAEPCARVIGTHLIHGDSTEDQQKRQKQVAQIVDSLAKKTFALPTFFLADSNVERDSKEGEVLTEVMRHGYVGVEETCTNRLASQWDRKTPKVWGEIIDCVSLFKETLPDGRRLRAVEEGVVFEEVHLFKAYDETYDTRKALSDHHGIVATVKIPLHTNAQRTNAAATEILQAS